MTWKRLLSCFYFCTSNPFGKLASQAKGQVKVIKTEQQWENLWCVIYLFVMEEMNPADSVWQWAAMIRQSVQILPIHPRPMDFPRLILSMSYITLEVKFSTHGFNIVNTRIQCDRLADCCQITMIPMCQGLAWHAYWRYSHFREDMLWRTSPFISIADIQTKLWLK